MNELKKLIHEIEGCCFNSFCLLTKSVKALTAEEMVRRLFYYRLGVILIVASISSICAFVALKLTVMLLVLLAGILIYVGYITYIEYQAQKDNLIFVRVTCTGSQKIWNAFKKPVFSFNFQGIGINEGVHFSLNRTEELGFAANVNYIFCFRRNIDNSIDNSSLVYYMEMSSMGSVEKASSQNKEKMEALKRVQANRKAVTPRKEVSAKEANENNTIVLQFGDIEEG